MRLVRLRTHAFRNLEPATLETDARFVVIGGPNAQGKTNLLEAVWVLASLRPLGARRWGEVVTWGGDRAVLAGEVRHEGDRRTLRLDVGPGTRTLRLDDTPQREVGPWFDAIRAIAFTPSDAEIVSDAPAVRRRWLDRAAFTAAPAHLARVQGVRRVLAQKREALQTPRPDHTLLDVLDSQLATRGAELVAARARTLTELGPHVETLHEGIAGGRGRLGLTYRTKAVGEDVGSRRGALEVALAAARPDELRRRRCLVGPQRDEVAITLDGRAARTFGSRGQVRSIVLALKLAELVAARMRGDRPLFLLDDLSSELDRDRTARLVEALVELDAQVWVTTTDPSHLGALPEGDALVLQARDGVMVSSTPP